MKKQAILFKTHFINSEILKEYENIRIACDKLDYDIFILYDNTKKYFKFGNVKAFLFSLEDFKNAGYCLVSESILPKCRSIQWFHADFPILFFYNKNKQYDYYWQIEFDVRFNGDWLNFFFQFKKDDSDFISTNIKDKNSFLKWNMWSKHNLNVEEDRLLSSSFPMVRFSNRALDAVDREYKNGFIGYCEITCPTIIKQKGFKISDIGKKNYNDFIFQFRHPIPYSIYNIIKKLPQFKNKLFHPVREKSILDLIISLLNIEFLTGQIGILLKSKIPVFYKILKPYFPDKNK